MSVSRTQRVDRSSAPKGQVTMPPIVSGTAIRKSTKVVPVLQSKETSKPPRARPAAERKTATVQREGQPAETKASDPSNRLNNPGFKQSKTEPSFTTNRLDDPNFQKDEAIAVRIVRQLKKEAKTWYEDNYEELGKDDPEFRYGGRFLHNREHIGQQALFHVAQKAPKGAHLHIHLNACLGPAFLMELAASHDLKNNMYISTNLQDTKKVATMQKMRKDAEDKAKKDGKQAPKIRNAYKEPLTSTNIADAKFQFHFLPYGWDTTCSLFSSDYHGRIGATEKAEDKTYDVMKFTDFLRDFGKTIKTDSGVEIYNKKQPSYRCKNWLIKKLVFQKDDVVFPKHKTVNTEMREPGSITSQWDMFNTRTQMMKGLFLAENAYRKYLQALFSSFNEDKIQYAEIRPNFMKANSVICTSKKDRIPIPNSKDAYYYDPKKMMDNRSIMDMIIGEFEDWKSKNPKATFKSMKIIMCTPRSRPYPIGFIEDTMKEAYEMKQDPKYKDWIAGFDFVGPELDGRTLKELKPQFDMWKAKYAAVGLKWILHCGESVYDRDGNLKFALNELNPHRLAHGYAIPKAALDSKSKAKLQKCCIETCPSSNEALGLAYDASCAAVYPLMDRGIPCSLSCDNPTLFNSTLSHEFYQVLVGKDDYGLDHWKKLMLYSIDHSVWNSPADKKLVKAEWEAQYESFVKEIVEQYKGILAKESQ